MNEQRNEKRMDELISRTINTGKPQFDAEKWKQKYPDEYQALLARAAKGDSNRQPTILKVILKSPLTKIAAAAVIILAVSFFSIHQDPGNQEQHGIAEVTKSPVEMLTAISLERAFRRGGIEAVENQCEQSLKLLGTRTDGLSSQELLSEFNGS
jgi:hypothetical protein